MIKIFFNVISNLKRIWMPLVALALFISYLTAKGDRENEGEAAMAKRLRRLSRFRYFKLHDLMINNGAMDSQIDHVVVSRYAIFVIETKDYGGSIVGSEWDQNWTQHFKKSQYSFHNPIRQNYGHVKAVEALVGDYDLPIVPIVAFSERAKLSVETKDNHVVYIKEVNRIIRKYRKKKITRKDAKRIYKLLKKKNINNFFTRRRHIRRINKMVKRKKEDVSKNICPSCGGELVLRRGKSRNFIGCSNYPNCKYKDSYRKNR